MVTRRDAPRTKVGAAAPSESTPTVSPPDGGARRRTTAATRRAEPAKADTRRQPGHSESPSASTAGGARVDVSYEARYRMISDAAYLRAERRGFVPGREVEDWLAAELEVERLLASEHASTPQ